MIVDTGPGPVREQWDEVPTFVTCHAIDLVGRVVVIPTRFATRMTFTLIDDLSVPIITPFLHDVIVVAVVTHGRGRPQRTFTFHVGNVLADSLAYES